MKPQKRTYWLLVLLFFIACGKKSKSPTKPSEPSDPVIQDTLKSYEVESTMLSPEQLSNAYKRMFDFKVGWTDELGRWNDAITTILGPSLGGIDFRFQNKREFLPKVQTHLIAQNLAWTIAASVVWNDINPETTQTRKIFAEPDIASLEPKGEKGPKWDNELRRLFLRVLNRYPTAAERELCAKTFNNVTETSDKVHAWSVLLFGLMASEEFWNLRGKP